MICHGISVTMGSVQVADDEVYLVMNAGCKDKDVEHISKHLKSFTVLLSLAGVVVCPTGTPGTGCQRDQQCDGAPLPLLLEQGGCVTTEGWSGLAYTAVSVHEDTCLRGPHSWQD